MGRAPARALGAGIQALAHLAPAQLALAPVSSSQMVRRDNAPGFALP